MAILSSKTSRQWTATQRRKANILAYAGIAIMAVAFWACGQPWIATAYSGTPNCPVTASATVVEMDLMNGRTQQVSIPATCQTGWELSEIAQGQSAVMNKASAAVGVGLVTAQPKFPLGWGGMPMVALVVAAAGALVAAGAYLRFSIGPFLAAAALFMSGQYEAATWRFMAGTYTSEQVATQIGWSALSFVHIAGIGIALAAGMYVLRVNIAARRRAAAVENKPSKSAWVSEVTSLVLRQAANVTARAGSETVNS